MPCLSALLDVPLEPGLLLLRLADHGINLLPRDSDVRRCCRSIKTKELESFAYAEVHHVILNFLSLLLVVYFFHIPSFGCHPLCHCHGFIKHVSLFPMIYYFFYPTPSSHSFLHVPPFIIPPLFCFLDEITAIHV